MDGVKRVAMVETKSVDTTIPGWTPVPRWRFQLDNHLGSACLEVDETGAVISYEEYHPYGTTAYQATKSGVDVSAKRYRYTGKERDEETGLYYHGARYYAAWLGRWVSADPLGVQAGINVYLYGRASPVVFTDPSGLDGQNMVSATFDPGQSIHNSPNRSNAGVIDLPEVTIEIPSEESEPEPPGVSDGAGGAGVTGQSGAEGKGPTGEPHGETDPDSAQLALGVFAFPAAVIGAELLAINTAVRIASALGTAQRGLTIASGVASGTVAKYGHVMQELAEGFSEMGPTPSFAGGAPNVGAEDDVAKAGGGLLGSVGKAIANFGDDVARAFSFGSGSTGRWGKGSFPTVGDSLAHHFEKHGAEVGATTVEQYLRKAEGFAQNLKRTHKFPVPGATPGVTRYVKSGKYIDMTPDGAIISFGIP